MNPEDKSRLKIDKELEAAGWVIQDRKDFNRSAALGIAVREFLMQDSKEADYLLFVDGKACAVIEAKKAGLALSGVENQSKGYSCHLPEKTRFWQMPLPFIYETNSEEIYFTDSRDINACSRRIFNFYRPETLFDMLNQNYTLRNNLKNMPVLNKTGLRTCQIEAIEGLEQSLANNKKRSLIHMATGAGKTFTACNFVYRLLKFAKAKRVLFLVDRNNLGKQTKKEFDNYILQGDNRKFTEVYIVQHLQQNKIDRNAKVVITTIQRLYSMLMGEEEYDEKNEEVSSYETGSLGKPKEINYNFQIPPEFFDFIIVDECHRSIYGDWQQILEYFDAFTIGLTATPSVYTLGYFNKNVVSEYPLERSIIDKVNVDCEIFRIKTKIGEYGSKVEAGFTVPIRDKKTRKTIYEQLSDDIIYDKTSLDKTVLAPNQIKTVLETYKQAIFTQLFPERKPAWIPKTLIFAKDDNHAEEIVRITRDVFGKGNDFCKKITYNIGNEKPEELIKSFRTDTNFRIAVTVDMIATGTDIKPLEVLIFMRDVKSQLYYEQMKGRGVRTITPTDLKSVTPNAEVKNHFYLIDAVGVTESKKVISQQLERKKTTSFKKLLEDIAMGAADEDTLSSLAVRISKLEANIEPQDLKKIREFTNGITLTKIANEIMDTIDYDLIENKSEKEIEKIRDEVLNPFNQPALRQLLLDLAVKSKLVIDIWSTDEVLTSEFGIKKAQDTIKNFKDFIKLNKDKIDALSIIYNTQYKTRHLTYEKIKELSDKLSSEIPPLETAVIWNAYKLIEQDKVKNTKDPAKLLTNLVQLVRFAIGKDTMPEDFSSAANSRFELWKGRQIKRGIKFTQEQLELLTIIKDYITANAYVNSDDMQEALSDKGGIYKARQAFGQDLDIILDDLSLALAG